VTEPSSAGEEAIGLELELALEAPRPSGLFRSLGRHQLGALFTTAVDFGAMIATVQLLHVGPVLATVVGAATGAVTNFTLARYWIFDRRDTLAGQAAPQALRYAFVSASSLGWNALGVWLLAEVAGLHYILARTLVAACVSLAWNFPMHRRFVFQSR
jgi:putative flippase GtrA